MKGWAWPDRDQADYRRLSLWWDQLESADAGPARPALTGPTTADVAIIGAGLTGLWTAYYLLRADPSLRVVLLEAETAGFGASGRNGGWCSALFPLSIDRLAKASDKGSARAMIRAMHDTVDEVGAVAAAEGIDAGYRKGGTVALARTPLQLDRAREYVEHWHRWGFGEQHHRLLDAAQARELLAATDVLGASYTPHCAAIQPARLVRGLARVVETRGATIHERTPVLAYEPGRVVTERGEVQARAIVRATEGYTARLPQDHRAVMPFYSSMIATEPLAATVWERLGLARGETFSDHRTTVIYGQRTVDDRIAFGGRGAPYHLGSRIEDAYDRDAAMTARLHEVLRDLLPDIADAAITHSWGGALGVPRDWCASVGFDPETRIGWAGGYVGDGVATTNLAGRTLSDLIGDRSTPLTDLRWANHRSPRWEPEPLRWVGANAALHGMAHADRVEERTGRPSRIGALVDRLTGH